MYNGQRADHLANNFMIKLLQWAVKMLVRLPVVRPLVPTGVSV